ncbi:MAG: peptidoglycan -binding protein [Hyphomicrobiaceae bacterium]|nr:peptidoglycan -binding protein [Hyphomicrobiaceae bacterium]
MARGRKRGGNGDYGEFWPGYVDVLSTLLLVVTFLMSIFMIAQFYVAQESSGKDTVLRRLTRQIAELTSILSLEKDKSKTAADELSALQATLSVLKAENEKLSGAGLGIDDKLKDADVKISGLTSDLTKEKEISAESLAKVEILNQQLAALRRQIAALNEALGAAEKRNADSQTTIKDMGARLNAALALQVQELKNYRSDFFGRLRTILAGRKDIRVVGDRFVFQSEVLFPSGQAVMSPEGLGTIDSLAAAILELQSRIPGEVDWALQVDGHTDARPISNPVFQSNWELSTARAVSVVKYLIARGVPAKRLVAAGYGEFHPLEDGATEDVLRRNRRIELKLTNR